MEISKELLEYFNGDELAASVWKSKYALRDKEGNFLEKTPDDMHRRLAKEFARIEKKYPNPLKEEEIYELLRRFKKIVPQGSPMYGIGNKYHLVSLSNCFVIRTWDSYGGILHSDQELAQIYKRRGGCGISLDPLRPSGMLTSNAAKTSTGIVPFMERFSNTTREVATAGRRGAQMQTLSIHHPQILDFIDAKRDLKKITGANLSTMITDEFMYAVERQEKYQQRFPVNKKVNPKFERWIDAKEVWDKIIDSAWTMAEPGILFADNIAKGPADIYYPSISTNPSLRGNTLILTRKGVFPLKELENKKIVIKNIRGEWRDAECFKSGYEKQLFKINISGYDIYATAEHKWPVMNSYQISDGFTLKTTSDLSPKDKLYFPLNEKPIDNEECSFTKEDGFILGWLKGDGCITKSNGKDCYVFIFSNNDIASGINPNRFLTYINSEIKNGKKYSILKNGESCKKILSSNKNIHNKFLSFGVCKKEDGICKSIWKSNHEFISGYIDGLFSSDGTVEYSDSDCRKRRITLTSVHKKLILDVQKLLMFYGIKSSFVKRKIKSQFPNDKYNDELRLYIRYDLKISNINAKKFSSIFKLSHFEKQQRLTKLLNYKPKQIHRNNINKDYLVVDSVVLTDIYEDVYDITTKEDTHTFIAEGIATSNCSEIPLSDKSSCKLLVLNLMGYVVNPFEKKSFFDYEKFEKDSYIAQKLMDDIVELESEKIIKIIEKVENDPEPHEIRKIEIDLWKSILHDCLEGRRTGLGITALGDCLASLGICYGSDDSIKETEKIYKTLAIGAYKSTIDMAKKRGKFDLWEYEKEKNHEFLNRVISNLPSEYQERYKKYGRRNVALTTTAPCGSVSCLTQTTSGIENAYLLEYTRRKKINPNDKNFRVDYVDEIGDSWQEYKVYHHEFKKWMEITGKTKIEESPYYKATSNDVDWKASVKLQAAAQKWVCHAISKTCNLPSDVSKELVGEVYMEAWKAGCKGFTVYRDGCRSGVLISSSEKQNKEKFPQHNAPKRPNSLECDIHHVTIQGEKWIVLIGLLENRPYETLGGLASNIEIPKKYNKGTLIKNKFKTKNNIYDLKVGENGNEFIFRDVVKLFNNPENAAFTRMISLGLRHGSPINYIVDQLQKDKNSDMFSFAKCISRVLKGYIEDGTRARSDKVCSQCKESTLVYKEGCVSCINCGTSKCG